MNLGSNPFNLAVLRSTCETFEELISALEREGFKPTDFTLLPTAKRSLESLKAVVKDVQSTER